jgi:DNA-binding SARP family transcriptional activator
VPDPQCKPGAIHRVEAHTPPHGLDSAKHAARINKHALYRSPSFSVLGPMSAHVGGTPVSLGPPQQQAIVAVLLLRSGQRVSVDQLIDAVWGECATATAEKTVRTYVYRLRQALGRQGDQWRSLITSVSGGYIFSTPAETIDANQFIRQEELARHARRAGDLPAVVKHAEHGLDLWHSGQALSGVPGEFAARMRLHLQELRLSSLEMRLSAQLSLGVDNSATAELSALVAQHPLDERFRSLFMIALHRDNRRADALLTYHEAREALRNSLGVDVGQEMKATYANILNDDPPPCALSTIRDER